MEDLMQLKITSKREMVLAPLIKHRVMYLSDLHLQCDYDKPMNAFYRLIKRLEGDGILISKLHHGTNRKMVFLSKESHRLLMDRSAPYISFESITHDSYLSSILVKLSKIPTFVDSRVCDLERRNGDFSNGLIPDGIAYFDVKELRIKVGIEVELTRKTKDRYIKKFISYLRDESFDRVYFFFDKLGVFNSYKEELTDLLHGQEISAEDNNLVLCYVPDMATGPEDFYNSKTFDGASDSTLRVSLGLEH